MWLQGCRTLGAEKEAAGTNDNLAEYHAQRVAQVRAQDGLNQTQTQLENEFATVLDSETPYATRFFKTFFNAKIYGWTMTAPGENAQSEKSLLFHISNVGRRLLLEDKISIEALENPTKDEIGEYAAATYFNAIVTLLTQSDKKAQILSSVEGWVDHGKRANPKEKIYGFSNPELKAYPPLMIEGDKVMVRARQLDCGLRRAKQPNEIESAVGDILATPQSIAFSFYTIKEVLEERMREVVTRKAVQKALARNKNLMDFLNLKINHKHIGVTKKLDYVGLYLLISEDRENPLITKILQEASAKLLAKIESGNYDRRDEKQWILKALIKNNLISLETLLGWIERSPDDSLVEATASSLSSLVHEKVRIDLRLLVKALLDNPRTTLNAKSSIFFAVAQLPFEDEEVASLLHDYAAKVVAKYDAGQGDEFSSLLTALGYVKAKIPGLEPIFQKIYSVIIKREGVFTTNEGNQQITVGNGDMLLGQLIRAVSNPVFEIKGWENYVLEAFNLFSKRLPAMSLSYHLYPLIEALDMRVDVPSTMVPILKMAAERLPSMDANSSWRKVTLIRVLSKSPEMFEVAKAEKNRILASGNESEIQYLVSSLSMGTLMGDETDERRSRLFELEDYEKIFKTATDSNLRNTAVFAMGNFPRPNAKIAAIFRDLLSGPSVSENIRPFLSLSMMSYETDLKVKREYFKRDYVDKANLSFTESAVAALHILTDSKIVDNPTAYLEKLNREAGFNPYLKGILLIYIVKQPATAKMKAWAKEILSAEDFVAESVGIITSIKYFTDIFANMSFTQLKALFKMVGNHPLLEPKDKLSLRKDLKRHKKLTDVQKAELLTLVK